MPVHEEDFMSKNIVIYGDLIQDINLLEHPLPPAFHFQTLPHTLQMNTDGGVAYMRKLLTKVFPPPDYMIKAPQIDQADWQKHAVKVFQTWARFPRLSTAGRKSGVSRSSWGDQTVLRPPTSRA